MTVVRWKFTDVYQKGSSPFSYTFHINPNEASSVTMQKEMSIQANAGPNRGIIVQEGSASVPSLSFSGIVLSQAHLEALEKWFIKRIYLELEDDLGRVYRGVFSSFTPSRPYKRSNFWWHTYQAEFQVMAYKNASGDILFGRFT